MKKLLLLAVAFLILAAGSASAAAPATPDYTANPVLNLIAKKGAKLFYLGNRLGLDGWFIVKEGQVQIAYATADNKGVLVGALFGQDGENITTLQVGMLVANNKEISDLLEKAQKEQAAMAFGGTSSSAAPQAQGGLPSVPLSPGERLIRELGSAAAVVVGKNPAAPELTMIMDPDCKHCHATWKKMRDYVAQGAVRVRMIPIDSAGKADNERAAAVLLGQGENAFDAFDKYVGGDRMQLAGTPMPPALEAVKANRALVDNWKIEATPYFVYRGRDGKVKIVQGEPENLPALMADIGG